ncbi:DUF1593 domain-containing protein [Cohnella hashimotonis]|uniref:DUF1593 domain-containing protein n=1 Tax=Cohnella hashimotonis TaxID=2826895 RepID=A0ABT6TEB1_9BACL|nr:nucleoside hydrolase-like domain-containing protein [Cohnella hashimotonis]MDI4645152.1 DUF1593 domain-containing protein [Cohnella hashimotonis]
MVTRTRVMVLTDISSLHRGWKEPDDTQSLVRLLLYANDLELEGLVATYSKHWDGEVKADYIEKIVKAYGEVRANLQLHDNRYPDEADLLGMIKAGNPCDGPDNVGDGHRTEGSDWIEAAICKEDDRPLWVTVWGGTTDLAQALWQAETRLGADRFRERLGQLRVYSVVDQYAMGSWVRDRYPELFYIRSRQGIRGMYKGGDASLVSDEWLRRYVTEGHGALGAAYPHYDGGDIYSRTVKGIKEGDSPSFLYLLPNGLGDSERPEWGSWGGRFIRDLGPKSGEVNRHYVDAEEFAGEGIHPDEVYWSSVYRWRDAFQRSFQARMDWCVLPSERGGREPICLISGPRERTVLSGASVELDGSASYDPRNRSLSYCWQVYEEAGTYRGTTTDLVGDRSSLVRLRAPNVSEPVTIHLILAVTNDGDPPLTSYGRVVLTVRPEAAL